MAETLRLTDVVGGPHCVSSDDGQLVHDQIFRRLRANKDVVVSFGGVEDVTSAFLNAAIGQLYGELDDETIRTHLQVIEADSDVLTLLKRVVERAKDFFKDPEKFNAAVSSTLGE
jgi:STAS-like domain of unknown function (DUF4325)